MPPPSAAPFAAHWVADALVGDETLDFSVVRALVGASPESLACAPEDTRERVALRCLQELVAVSAEGEVAAGVAVAGGEMLRVDATRSCKEVLLDLIGQVCSPGSLAKDMLQCFSEDIQKFICMKIPTLPVTSFELLREVNPDITSIVPPSPVEKSGKNNVNDQSFCIISHDHVNTEKHGHPRDSSDLQRENLTVFVSETDTRDGERPHDGGTNIQSSKDLSHRGSTMQSTVALDSDRSTDALPIYTSEKSHLHEFVVADDTDMIAQPFGRKTRNSPQPDHCEKTSQDLDEGGARIQLVDEDPGHNEPSLQTAGAVPFVSYAAVQEDKSETEHPQEDVTEHSQIFKQRNGDKANLEVSSADKANPALQDDGNILKNTSCGDQTAIYSPCCNVALHNKSSEVDSLSEKNTEKNMADRSVLNSPQDGNKEGTKRAANKKIMGNAVVETSNVHCSDDSSSDFAAACLLSLMTNMPSSTQDKDANGSIEGFTEQDLCIKCGKDGQLLKCGTCLLAAHESCFGSLVTFDVSGQLYCPVCFYTKATEAYQKAKTAYSEARKNLCAFLGTKQFAKQHNEQSPGKQPAATSSKYHLNECNTSNRQGNNQSEADSLSHRDEEPGQLRKKQRTNDTSDACPEENQLNGCNASKRQDNDQPEADNLSHKDEEPCQQRKKQRKNDTNDACPEEDQLNGCNTSVRQGNHQSGAYNLSHKDLESGQQKTNATTDTCTEEVITEKACFVLNSGVATNKDCVLRYKRRQVHVAEDSEDGNGKHGQPVENSETCEDGNGKHGQPVENAEAREDGNGNSLYEAQHSSQNRCSPVTSQNVEPDKHDCRINSHECENSDEIEASSSNDSGKRSSPPWRTMRHHKAGLQQKKTVISNNSKKALGCQDEHMPSPSRKRNYAYPPKRYSNPVGPVGRRPKLCWTEEEEQGLRDAMLKFTGKDDGPIPWVQILEYGRDVFHKTRLPSDLRVKWRNMKKKS
uniref:Uncharacterized protein n=1 Tax=Avena sativa TaxID=4498 RepID=A0ACD5V2D7_AVESA